MTQSPAGPPTRPPTDPLPDPLVGQPSGSLAGRDRIDATDDRSLGQIVSDVSNDFATLMKQEVELAKVELKQEMTKAGAGAGMLGGAGLSGWFVLLFLSLALVFLLDNWMPIEVAALITALLWAVIAAVLAVLGRKKLKEANPELPKTQQSLKEDAQWAKAQRN